MVVQPQWEWDEGTIVRGHPNICPLIDFFEDRNFYYLILLTTLLPLDSTGADPGMDGAPNTPTRGGPIRPRRAAPVRLAAAPCPELPGADRGCHRVPPHARHRPPRHQGRERDAERER
jgi:hypothetical protein